MNGLNQKKVTFTKNLLLDAACTLTQTLDISELSFKRVSQQADISERTMFRHFSNREAFLDELTARLYAELELPDVPHSLDELAGYITLLYQKMDAQPRKVEVLLSADLLPRVLNTAARARFESLKQLLSENYPDCSSSDIAKTAANLRYVMSASSWRYYRMNFDFDLETSTDCARMLVTQALRYLQENQLKKSNLSNR